MKMTNHESILEKSWYIGAEGVVNSVPPSPKEWLYNKISPGEGSLYSRRGVVVLIHYKKLALTSSVGNFQTRSIYILKLYFDLLIS